MIIEKVTYSSFMGTDGTVSRELPASGIVLVTGKNGKGKSTLLETVSHALYNQSIRDRKNKPVGWRKGVAGQVSVKTPDGELTRKRTASGSHTIDVKDGGEYSYTTQTKAQEHLAKLYPSFDVWRRSCVFVSKDAARFSVATDKERKALLEEILDLKKFDAALKACRSDLSETRRQLTSHQHELASLTRQIELVSEQVASAEKAQEALKGDISLDSLREQCLSVISKKETSQAKETGLRKELEKLLEEKRELSQKVASAKLVIHEAETQKCSRCGQSLPHNHTSGNFPEYMGAEEDLEELEVKLKLAEERLPILREELSEASRLTMSLATEEASIQQKGISVKRNLELAATWEADKLALDKRLAALETDKERFSEALTALERELQILLGCEKVLGIKGMRAHILADALKSLETSVNYWLARIVGSDISVRIAEEKDEIVFDLQGYADGAGYTASSSGQRARVDLSFVFALGDVASASSGRTGGTLWLDEVLDGLDDEGIEGVLQALNEIAQSRCIVLITHNNTLKNYVEYVEHIEV